MCVCVFLCDPNLICSSLKYNFIFFILLLPKFSLLFLFVIVRAQLFLFYLRIFVTPTLFHFPCSLLFFIPTRLRGQYPKLLRCVIHDSQNWTDNIHLDRPSKFPLDLFIFFASIHSIHFLFFHLFIIWYSLILVAHKQLKNPCSNCQLFNTDKFICTATRIFV